MPTPTDMSVQRLENKLKIKPNSLVFSRLADSYRKSGDVQQAIAICSRGLELHPDYVTGRIILGRCYLEQENFNDAIKEFTQVCRLDRHNQIAIKMLADVFSKQGMEEKAGDLYNLLFKMDPENPSLEHLITVFKGSDKSNLYEILGVEESAVQTAPIVEEDAGVGDLSEEGSVEPAEPETLEEVGVADEEDVGLPQGDEVVAQLEEVIPEASGMKDEAAPETAMEEVAAPAAVEQLESAAEPGLEELQLPDEKASEQALSGDEGIPEEIAELEESLPEDITAEQPSEEAGLSGAETESRVEVSEEEVPSLDDVMLADEEAAEKEAGVDEIQGAPEVTPTEELGDDIDLESAEEKTLEVEMDAVLVEEGGEAEGTADGEELAVEGIEELGESIDTDIPEKDDISARMDAMFGNEGAGEVVTPSTVTGAISAEAEEDALAAITDSSDGAAGVPEVSDAGVEGEQDEMSSRVENMFAEAEELVVPTGPEAGESAPEEVGELVQPVESVSEPTRILDKERAPVESREESEPSPEELPVEGLLEEAESTVGIQKDETISLDETLELEQVEQGFQELSEEATPLTEELTLPEQDVTATPTELPDQKEEILAETQDLSDIPAAPSQTPTEELIPEDFMEEEHSAETASDATAVYDREMIREIADAEVAELDETFSVSEEVEIEPDETLALSDDTTGVPTTEVPAAPASVSGDEVISRLDEMFPMEEASEPVHVEGAETQEIRMDLPAGEEIDTLGVDGLDDTVELSTPAETGKETDMTAAETASYDRDRLDEVLSSSETEIYTREQLMEWEEEQTDSFELDTVETGEPLSGEEVVSRIDEMFTGDDTLQDGALATIPDEEVEETESVGEFYTESGDAASLEGVEAVALPEEEPTVSDESPEDISLDEEPAESVLTDDVLMDDTLASIPEDESIESEPVGEFYTESGDAASLEGVEAVALPEEEPTVSDESPEDISLDEEPAESVLTDDVLMDDTLASIPESESIESEPVGEFYTESGDAASLESTEAVLDNEVKPPAGEKEVEESLPEVELPVAEENLLDEVNLESLSDEGREESILTGELHIKSADSTPFDESEFLVDDEPDDSLEETATYTIPSDDMLAAVTDEVIAEEESLADIPDEGAGESEPVSEFYTESGATAATEERMQPDKGTHATEIVSEEAASAESSEEFETVASDDGITDEFTEESVLDSVDEEEFYTITGEDAPAPLADKESSTFRGEEVSKEYPDSREAAHAGKGRFGDKRVSEKELLTKRERGAEKADAIPDHVLTPTLADIYFQQDQPYLAIQIYKRLLERDPDNDRIERRIAEIEQVIKESESEIEEPAPTKKTQRKKAGRKRKTARKKNKGDSRPLKGVRIKKKVKERIRKKK